MFLTKTLPPRLSRRGTVAVLTAVCLIVIMAALAIALDGGTLLAERRHAQAGADAAAFAAACDLYDNYWANNGTDPNGTALASALNTAKANGYSNDGNQSVVTVNIPPKGGDYVGQAGYVEVIVQYYQTRGFSNIFSAGPIPVQARAVALGSPVAADVGILVLDPTGKGALNAQGSGGTTVQGTPIVVDSNNPEAAIAGGGGTLTAQEFDITGGYTTAGPCPTPSPTCRPPTRTRWSASPPRRSSTPRAPRPSPRASITAASRSAAAARSTCSPGSTTWTAAASRSAARGACRATA
jgi:Flp pilus assembly protein TadG